MTYPFLSRIDEDDAPLMPPKFNAYPCNEFECDDEQCPLHGPGVRRQREEEEA